MTAIVEICTAFGLVVAAKETVTIHMHATNMGVGVVKVEAAGDRYKQLEYFLHLGGEISCIGEVTPEIRSRTGQAWTCLYKYSRAVYDNPHIALTTKVLLKTEVVEGVLYGCAS